METRDKEIESWIEYKRLVLKSLEDMHSDLAELKKEVNELKTSITIIKTQAGVISAFIGIAISVIVTFVLNVINKHM